MKSLMKELMGILIAAINIGAINIGASHDC